MQSSDYQPEIDGLRAIAVMSVVLFHAQFPFFTGGFVGVDVFFVVSGFLITRIIKDSIEADTFSFPDFYVRRARRLFPALYVTVVVTFLAAMILFMPSHLERLGGALVSSLFWVSNFFFWSESGYFDADSYVKPLLHTWSLSVEEQFYLVWPVTLFVFLSRKKLRKWFPLLMLGSVLASLYWTQSMLVTNPSAAFFLPVSRVSEFGIGALLVWVVAYRPTNRVLLEPLLLTGIALILFAVVNFNKVTEFPGLSVLVPCIGAALVIYAGTAPYSGMLLRNRLAVSIGLISYSLYLVHWPIVVFLKYHLESFTPPYRVGALLLAFVAAYYLHKFVETPFRRPAKAKALTPRHYALVWCLLSAIIVVPALAVRTQEGWPERWNTPDPILELVTKVESKKLERRRYVWDEHTNNQDSFDDPNPGTRVLIVGDSHSTDVFNAVFLNKELFPSIDVRRIALPEACLYMFGSLKSDRPRSVIKECPAAVDRLQASALTNSADWIILSARWHSTDLEHISGFAQYVAAETSARLGVMGRTAEFADVPKLAWRHGKLEGLETVLAHNRDRSIDALNDQMHQTTLESGAVFLDKVPLVCDLQKNTCNVLDKESKFLFADYGHWTLEGAEHFGEKMARVGFFSPLTEEYNYAAQDEK